MAEYNHGSHTVHDIKYHIVWITKYRYKVIAGKISQRLRELLIQGCTARGITICRRKYRQRSCTHAGVLSNESCTKPDSPIPERSIIETDPR